MKSELIKEFEKAALIGFIALLLGLFTASEYFGSFGNNFQERINYLEYGDQIIQHVTILEANSGNPWQYRILTTYLIEIIINSFEKLHIPHYIAVSFMLFRITQDTLIFLISYKYYKTLGLPPKYAMIGLAILAWSISYSHYDSDLQFNTFFDVIFYLLAALFILQEKYVWFIPITIFATLNRETSGLIPFLFFFSSLITQKRTLRKTIPIFFASISIYFLIFLGLRIIYGEQELFIPYGHHPGLDLLQYNIFRLITWQRLVATLSIIPALALIGYSKWTPHLKVFFWVIVPCWFTVHAFAAVMAETRLFLVPQAVVFIPGVLSSLVPINDLSSSTKSNLGASEQF